VNETRPYSRFRSLCRISLPGSHINEDGVGLHGRCAWVVDGATGVAGHRLTTGATDAAWLAGALGESLRQAVPALGAADDVFQHLERGIREAFGEEMARASSPENDHHPPSACLGLVRLQDAPDGQLVLEGRFLGDVVALVPAEEGIVRWSDERAKPFERRTLAVLGASDRRPGEIPEAVRRQILENRNRLNHPDGYWVVNPRRPWAGRELRFQARIALDRPVVLATDGFMRLVDVFAAYSEVALYDRLAAGAGESLMQELRELERSDPAAEAYPRVKIHDDATVHVIAAERCG
jgi:hypothetical protein